jgi:MFS family permease
VTASRPVEAPDAERTTAAVGWSAWRAVVGFGVVSLAADMVYEGARSVYGPLLAALGASAFVVGLVTGAGETAALVLRLAFGRLADRTGRYWSLTLAGYGLTAVCVPLLAVTPFIGGAGLALAIVLILAERCGKAVRSPSKSTLLAHAAGAVGRGRGFAVHKALDQVGAFAGPLLVAGIIALTAAIWPAMAALAVPGAAALGLLAFIRRRVPDPAVFEPEAVAPPLGPSPGSASSPMPQRAVPSTKPVRLLRATVGADLPRRFFLFAAAVGATSAGLITFGLVGYHLATQHLVPVAGVPLVYAAAMATEAVAALVTGFAYDRWHGWVLVCLPVLVTAVPALVFTGRLWVVVLGVLAWGAAVGVQDSTVKSLVADLVPAARLATAYGVFAAVQGAAAVLGGGAAGALYSRSVPALVGVVAATQVVAAVLLALSLRDDDPPEAAD